MDFLPRLLFLILGYFMGIVVAIYYANKSNKRPALIPAAVCAGGLLLGMVLLHLNFRTPAWGLFGIAGGAAMILLRIAVFYVLERGTKK